MKDHDKTVRNVITPNDQFLSDVYNVSKPYYIDIYQREYKWTEKNLLTLLNDIENRFGEHKRTKIEPKEIRKDVNEHFEPYFLNTYLNHTTANNISIVDGQQRLTTFLLIFIKLHKILKLVEEDENNTVETFNSDSLKKLIFESADFGDAARFKIYNENRESSFNNIVNNIEFEPEDQTQKCILDNYGTISKYFDKFLAGKDNSDQYDITKLTYYISYLLDRISIVEIKIEKQKNVEMIFEVVNDRGLGLKPYEILKGKLIGNLSPENKEKANKVWTRLQDDFFNATLKNSTESKIDLDNFFQTFFRAKFADSENDYEKFESDYHYEIYRDEKIRKYFKDYSDQNLLYKRIVEDIQYFADLYLWLRTNYENEYLLYNKLLDQNQQYLLILSNVALNDSDKDAKITGIAKKFDQFHSIIRLLDVYESNAFQRMIYPINKDIRDVSLEKATGIFDKNLIGHLESEEIVGEGEISSLEDLFTYDRLKIVRNRWVNFSKYVLMRIDRYLAEVLDKPSYAGGGLEELEEYFNKTTRRRYGMHLEHIYAYNEPNKKYFTDSEDIFDEQEFIRIRNLLSMVVLLKDKQNLSSGNDVYKDKLDTYSKSNFIWNELMAGHVDNIDMRNLPDDLRIEVIQPDESGAFPKNKIEQRQRCIQKVLRHIWWDNVQTK